MIVYYIGMENENLIPFLVTFFCNKNVYYSNISFGGERNVNGIHSIREDTAND